MTVEDFAFLAEFLRRRSGLLLPSHKAHLIEGRLRPVARRFGFRDVGALLRDLRYAHEALAQAVTEAMTTNDTAFFRDPPVFESLCNGVLPNLIAARSDARRLRFWSAACAAGQEAYSIAMLLDGENLAAMGWSIDLIATDLSSDLIARAEEGVYTEFEVQRGLPDDKLATYFSKAGKSFRVRDSLRRLVSFRTFNLLDSCGWLYDIDVVFCRNVLIYFDDRTKRQVIEKISEVLSPDGVLILGNAETTAGLSDEFAALRDYPGAFVKPATPASVRFSRAG